MEAKIGRCYFCDGPFQVLTCMHMQMHNDSSSDIYVINYFHNSEHVVNALRKYSLFRKVLLVERESIESKNTLGKLRLRLSRLLAYFNIDRIVESFMARNTVYECMFVDSNEIYSRLARLYFIKKRTGTRCFFYDDGLGSYEGHFEKLNIFDRMIRYTLFGKKSINMNLDLYLYMPELIEFDISMKRTINRIAPFDEIDRSYLDCYRDVFGAKPKDISKSIIYFDTIRNAASHSAEAKSIIQGWFDRIEDALGYENLFIKPHPSVVASYPHKCEEYPGRGYPMEIDYLDMNIDNLILISYASTAVLTPKVFFNKEPIVLILCSLNKTIWKYAEGVEKTFIKARSLYSNQDRFMIPQNEKEFIDSLEKIKNLLK